MIEKSAQVNGVASALVLLKSDSAHKELISLSYGSVKKRRLAAAYLNKRHSGPSKNEKRLEIRITLAVKRGYYSAFGLQGKLANAHKLAVHVCAVT